MYAWALLTSLVWIETPALVVFLGLGLIIFLPLGGTCATTQVPIKARALRQPGRVFVLTGNLVLGPPFAVKCAVGVTVL